MQERQTIGHLLEMNQLQLSALGNIKATLSLEARQLEKVVALADHMLKPLEALYRRSTLVLRGGIVRGPVAPLPYYH